MTREQLLRSPHYWLAYIQNGMFKMIEDYRNKNRLKKKDLAEKMGVTKGYVSQILNGDFDHKISKLVELSLACGKIPQISYSDLEQFIKDDLENKLQVQERQNITNIQQNIIYLDSNKAFNFDESFISLLQRKLVESPQNLRINGKVGIASITENPELENEYSNG